MEQSFSLNEAMKEILDQQSKEQEHTINHRTQVVTARFRNRDKNLQLSTAFRTWAYTLGNEKYNYYQLFEQFGTHYIQGGELGGVYSKSYILKQTEYNAIQESHHQLKWCIGVSTQATIKVVTAEAYAKHCSDRAESIQTKTNEMTKNIRTKTTSLGASSGELKVGDIEALNEWYDDVRNSPALVKIITKPICGLLGMLKEFASPSPVQDNCNKFLKDYIQQVGGGFGPACLCNNGDKPIYNMGFCKCVPDNIDFNRKAPVDKQDLRCKEIQEEVRRSKAIHLYFYPLYTVRYVFLFRGGLRAY